jgi:hypothetical protein
MALISNITELIGIITEVVLTDSDAHILLAIILRMLPACAGIQGHHFMTLFCYLFAVMTDRLINKYRRKNWII